MSRAHRLLSRALGKSSPESFVAAHPEAVGWYSPRSVRHWLKGADIPDHVADALRNYLKGDA